MGLWPNQNSTPQPFFLFLCFNPHPGVLISRNRIAVLLNRIISRWLSLIPLLHCSTNIKHPTPFLSHVQRAWPTCGLVTYLIWRRPKRRAAPRPARLSTGGLVGRTTSTSLKPKNTASQRYVADYSMQKLTKARVCSQLCRTRMPMSQWSPIMLIRMAIMWKVWSARNGRTPKASHCRKYL